MRIRARALLLAGALLLTLASTAWAGTANGGLAGAPRGNPLAGLPWGHYTGASDGLWAAYAGSSGATHRLLGKIALRPAAHWFGAWTPDGAAESDARNYVRTVTGGNPNVLTQFAVFRLDPWEGANCSVNPGPSRQSSFRTWIDGFARGIGSSRALIVLQPDLPFALCGPGSANWLRMVDYAASRFNGLPHTTVYLDAGAYQWISPSRTAAMLAAAGIRHVRGFSLDDTEYDTTARELGWGQRIEQALAARGITGKHLLVSTAMNGAGFLNGQYPGDINNPRTCASPHDHLCVTLGIPPTTDVASPRWHLGSASAIARRYADAYVWVGRPWLSGPSSLFDLRRALALVRSWPFLSAL